LQVEVKLLKSLYKAQTAAHDWRYSLSQAAA
jgi:hypothetical protein